MFLHTHHFIPNRAFNVKIDIEPHPTLADQQDHNETR